MAEWPKQITVWWPQKVLVAEEDVSEDEWRKAGEYEVIPADLGRELYEALIFARNASTRHPLTPETTKQIGQRFVDAIARYEREVGGD